MKRMKRFSRLAALLVSLCLIFAGVYIHHLTRPKVSITKLKPIVETHRKVIQPSTDNTGDKLDKVKNVQKTVYQKQLTAKPDQLIGSANATCRVDPMAGVWEPSRLKVLNPCMTVSGIVQELEYEPSDGDYHFNLLPDSKYRNLLFPVNNTQANGDLVVEIIPMDDGKFPIPKNGEHVTITGAYVLDTGHMWAEIHPVWRINGQGNPAYTEDEAYQSVVTALDKGLELHKAAKISLVSSQLFVPPAGTASVTIKTVPHAAGVLFIHYGSQVQQLPFQYANASGNISWHWVVSSGQVPGSYPIYVEVYARRLNLTLTVTRPSLPITNATNGTQNASPTGNSTQAKTNKT